MKIIIIPINNNNSYTMDTIDTRLEFDVTFTFNLLRITPYLYNTETETKQYYQPHNYELFKSYAFNYVFCVIIKVENKKYIVNARTLLENQERFHDNSIFYDNYKINCYPGSKLYKACKSCIHHEQPIVIRIRNFRIIGS